MHYRVIALGRMRMSTDMIPAGINNLGQIAGVGAHNGHHYQAFLLTPLH